MNRTRILALVLLVALAVPVVAPVAARAAEPSSSAQAWADVRAKVDALAKEARSTRSQDRLVEILADIQKLLETFRRDHPDAPEALDAAFELGSLHYSRGMLLQSEAAYREAIRFLEEYAGADAGDRSKRAAAYFYLGECYKAVNDFDRAEKAWKTVVDRYADADARVTEFARRNLAALDTERRLAPGNEPIDFEVRSITGDVVGPSKFRGKVLLLDFWATWCGPCRAEMPNVKRVYAKYHDKGFEILGISLDRSRRDLDRYLADNGITWPQYFDGKYWQNEIAQRYGIQSIPSTFLIDRKGKIRYRSLRGPALERAVRELIEEKG